METGILVMLGGLLVIQLVLWHKKRRKLGGLFLNITTGLAALLPMSLLTAILPLNVITTAVSCILGMPGVLLMGAAAIFTQQIA